MERLEQIERCRECHGHVVRADDEYACTSCGVVSKEQEVAEARTARQTGVSRTLGSYMGRPEDKRSTAYFNGNSTVGFAKRLSDNMGVDKTERKCRAMISRASDRLSLPAFVQQNALALTQKVLAEGGGNRCRNYLAAASAYALLSAARAAGMDHVSPRAIMQAFDDIGQRVTASAFLHLGMDSSVPLRPSDPAVLLRTIYKCLESNEAVLKRLRKNGAEPGPYFRNLLLASQTVLAAMGGRKDGRNPRTVAASSVYIASLDVTPRAVLQREVAEIAGLNEYTIREFCSWARKGMGPLNPGPS